MGFLGLDPGQSGGIAYVTPYGQQAYPMPPTEKDISDLIADLKPQIGFAVIEAVHSMPKQGVASSFKFGRNYGFLRGLLIAHGIPFAEVSPQKWQAFMGCKTGGDKNVSKAKAQQLFPNLKITHAVADALLIAEYARYTYGSCLDDL